MLRTREDCWPDDDNPSERYLHVSADHSSSRIEIFEDKVMKGLRGKQSRIGNVSFAR